MSKKKIRMCIMALAVCLTANLCFPLTAEAAGSKKLRTVSVKIGNKKVTKKTYKMKKGKTVTLKVKVAPASAKKSVSYKSSNKKIVTVSKKGKLIARKTGTAKVKITVKAKRGKQKTTWVKIKVTADTKKKTDAKKKADTKKAAGTIEKDTASSSATCNHNWKLTHEEDVEQPAVYLKRATEYNVCTHCGYMGSFEEVGQHCRIFGGGQTSIRLGPELVRQDWICTDYYKCTKCGKERTEVETKKGEETERYYANQFLQLDTLEEKPGRVKCPVCKTTSTVESLKNRDGICICGNQISYTEEDMVYPWNLSKAYPNMEDEHYYQVDRDGQLILLK